MENSDASELFVFVGEKIEVKSLGMEGMDAKFLARYKVLDKVCGNYSKDTLEFIVYDHYGEPAFSNYQTVMLFVSKYEDTFYHEKYQYFDVYKTQNGKWASSHSWTDSNKAIPPYSLKFKTEVSFDVSKLKKQRVKEIFPAPYYTIENKKAIAKYGHYVEDILELKKRGVLHYRGLFGVKEDIEVIDTELASFIESPKISASQNKALRQYWKQFLAAIISKNTSALKSMSIDSVVCSVCEGFSETYFYNDKEPVDSFISSSYRNFPGSKAWNVLMSNKFTTDLEHKVDSSDKYCGTEQKNKIIYYNIIFQDSNQTDNMLHIFNHTFTFIKIRDSFKFYGMKTF
ncbi:MAG: hypothetical protein EOP53_06600 [Sphingobacteriales bacterium]|nr:MAG: hypothetical protein EOP53_06600 [Sphingobacteriales bacterium]